MLNSDQQAAVKEIVRWATGTEEQFLCLSGAGGTGKTLTLKEAEKAIYERWSFQRSMDNNTPNPGFFVNKTVVVTATTNEAVDCLRQVGFHNTTTCYTTFALKVQENWADGTTSVQETRATESNIKYFKGLGNILIIDEASYIDKKMFNFIKSNGIRTLFVGDAAQLLAVSSAQEGFSVFNASLGIKTISLTRNERATDSDLQELNQSLREAVLNGTKPRLAGNDTSILLLEDNAFLAHMKNHYRNENALESKVITFRKASATRYNQAIRKWLELPNDLVKGDYVIANDTYSPEYENITIHTSSRIRVHTTNIEKDLLPRDTLQHFASIYGVFPTLFSDYKGRVIYTLKDQEKLLYELKQAAIRARQDRRWKRYFDFKKGLLQYRLPYAENSHKSQGRSYDYVYVDLPDIMENPEEDLVKRLLYVSVSRARAKVIIRKPGGV